MNKAACLSHIEYVLSRGKFLFTTDQRQKIQAPSYTLTGPCAPISELGALYNIFGKASPAQGSEVLVSGRVSTDEGAGRDSDRLAPGPMAVMKSAIPPMATSMPRSRHGV